MQIDLALGMGIVGAALILFAFLLNQLDLWHNDYLLYDVTNFVGSALLVYYAWDGASYPFLVLNTVWAFFSLKDVIYDIDQLKKGKRKFHFYHFSRQKK